MQIIQKFELPYWHETNNRYPVSMFLFNKCQKSDCELFAANGEDYCLHHVDDPEACNKRLISIIQDTKELKDLNSSCITVEDADFSFPKAALIYVFFSIPVSKTAILPILILSIAFLQAVPLLTVILRIQILYIPTFSVLKGPDVYSMILICTIPTLQVQCYKTWVL